MATSSKKYFEEMFLIPKSELGNQTGGSLFTGGNESDTEETLQRLKLLQAKADGSLETSKQLWHIEKLLEDYKKLGKPLPAGHSVETLTAYYRHLYKKNKNRLAAKNQTVNYYKIPKTAEPYMSSNRNKRAEQDEATDEEDILVPDYGLDDEDIDWSLSTPPSSPGTPEKFTPSPPTKQHYNTRSRGQTGRGRKKAGAKNKKPELTLPKHWKEVI